VRRLTPLAIALAIAGCLAPTASVQSFQSVPSLEEAQGFLAKLVTLARRGDFTSFCAVGDLNCERSLDTAGRNAVPPAPPTVIDVRIVPNTTSGDQVSIGGLVLVMCGEDATGERYRSEMLVFRDRTGLRAINPVYWGNGRISGGTSTAASPLPSPAC
jgi:hypothetical protein